MESNLPRLVAQFQGNSCQRGQRPGRARDAAKTGRCHQRPTRMVPPTPSCGRPDWRELPGHPGRWPVGGSGLGQRRPAPRVVDEIIFCESLLDGRSRGPVRWVVPMERQSRVTDTSPQEAGEALTVPRTLWLASPMSAREKRPIAPKLAWQRNNHRLQFNLRQSTTCALGRKCAVYRYYLRSF